MGILHARNFVTEDDAIGGSIITKSVRFNDDNSAYLNRTPASASNKKKWTSSFWVKRANLGTDQKIFSAAASSTSYFFIEFTSADKLQVLGRGDNAFQLQLLTSSLFRDTSAWYHIVVYLDSANSAAKLYVNGTEPPLGTNTQPTVNYNFHINNNKPHNIGRSAHNDSDYFDGYIAQFHHIDGQVLAPTDFAFTDSQTGIWRPKRYEGTFGTNGFYLPLREGSLFKEYVVPTASFSDDANTIFLLNNNESNASTTFTDTEGNTVSAVGDVQHSTAQAKFGSSSIIFDGSGDNLSVGGNGTFLSDLTTSSNRTYEGWIWFDSYVYTWLYSASSNQQYLGVAINAAATGSYISFAGNQPSPYTAAQGDIPGGAWPLNQWVHVFVQRNADGSMLVGFDGKILYEGSELVNNTTSGTVGPMKIGSQHYYNSTNRNFHDGYMDELRMSDTPRYTSTGVNSIGKDLSGNNNFFAPSGFVSNDLVLDSPTNNFCTLNPLTKNMGASSNGTVSNGNLEWLGTQNNDNIAATIAVKSGKWYYEMTVGQNADKLVAGWTTVQETTNYNESALIYYNSAGIRGGNITVVWDSTVTSSLTFATNDVIGFALNLDDYFLYVYENGSLVSKITLPTDKGDTWIPCCGDSSSTDASATFNFGQQSFTYTPPTGYKSLNSINLTPNLPTVIKPQKHFDTLLYTGNGGTQSISGLSFTPDFVWLKKRNGTTNHLLFDSLRGINKSMNSNGTGSEDTSSTDKLTSFNSDGFTLGSNASNNNNSDTYVAWCWKGGGTAVSNSDGSITSSVSANQTAGFSIISYTGSGSAATVGHGLGKSPSMIIIKSRSATGNWDVHAFGTIRFSLNLTEANQNNNQCQFTNTTFSLVDSSANRNGSGVTYIAYCWAEIPGYSKFGSYTGNGSSDGVYIHLGFRPAFVLLKRTNSSQNWWLLDNKRNSSNVLDKELNPNTSQAEATFSSADFLANGFKLRSDNVVMNGSGSTYFYMAFAERTGVTPLDTFPNAR